MVLGWFKKKVRAEESFWRGKFDTEGLSIYQGVEGTPLDAPLLTAHLAQLADDGLLEERSDGGFLSWDSLYQALSVFEDDDLAETLKLPPFSRAVPGLRSSGALTDPDFSIAIDGWSKPGSKKETPVSCGALLRLAEREELMPPKAWQLLQAVKQFTRRNDEQREAAFQRQSWADIRALAIAAGAQLDDFLYRSVVLSPERLQLGMRKGEVGPGSRLVEIMPSFEGAPVDWLERFDARADVPDLYNITTDKGMLQIVITPQVRTVLEEIKRMDHRRVAGSRAEAFILNPYAALGPDAVAVIDEADFQQARQEAGLGYERFSPLIEFDRQGIPSKVALLIESVMADGQINSEVHELDARGLEDFVLKLEQALSRQHQLLAWEGFDLEIQGESLAHLDQFKAAMLARGALQPGPQLTWEQVYDLSSYSSRIEGIGDEKLEYSPYIAKKGPVWVPDEVEPIVVYTPASGGEPAQIHLEASDLDELDKELDKQKPIGSEDVAPIYTSKFPDGIPAREAQAVLAAFGNARKQIEQGDFDPPSAISAGRPKSVASFGKASLLLRANINQLDFDASRLALKDVSRPPEVPSTLRDQVKLLPHQLRGLAWLQHLYRRREDCKVGGCLLADDMGLGKTFQLLSFMAWCIEMEPGIDPMLVVAPVSLLENWKGEAEKFLREGSLPLLMAYGDGLANLRLSRQEIDQRLRDEAGLVKFLRPGWVGDAKLVLTTYETLRDLEFSFAAQRWSVMVCDEAQKIKNPVAMVTRSAKKQNVTFKIACTGTPVENTLADLWCLFDYVQPGLLGALDEFGKRYRKPIEARNDEEKARIEDLRDLISPQILRRTKIEVATDLPAKLFDKNCTRLPMSTEQRNLYAQAVKEYKLRALEKPGAMFQLLHELRRICSDPCPRGMTAGQEAIDIYRRKSPKMDWLLRQLEVIRNRQEKVIIFCEFRDLQRRLQHYIKHTFGFKADIINGDTSTAVGRAGNRQQRITDFQAQSGFGVLILSPVAVGFGVNIQTANHVIHFTRTWNPAKEDQATDRAYRIGQTRDVTVYCPVVVADDFNSFDATLAELLDSKRRLAEDMLNGAGDVGTGDFKLDVMLPKTAAVGVDPRIDLAVVDRLTPHMFEGLLACLWARSDFERVYCTPVTGDHGVDVVALCGASGELIQAKSSANGMTRLGWDAIKEVVGGSAYYQRLHPKVTFAKTCVTNQLFNANAHEQAELNEVRLIERNELGAMLEQIEIRLSDVHAEMELGSAA